MKSNTIKEDARNIYGYNKRKFTSETAKENVEKLITDFKTHYSLLGYKEKPSVLISSGIDSSVRFIGSHISVFKSYLTENNVPFPGIFIRQNCIRTRNANKLLDDSYFIDWGSYFPSIGALTPAERLDETCNEIFDFFEERLNISPENILIRINSDDVDLLNVCKGRYKETRLELDSRNLEYYRHELGMQGIWGRNFNIALRNPDKDGFSDVGNVILIENAQNILGIETALGSTVILKQLYGLDHVQDCIPVNGLDSENNTIRRKFEDSIITSIVLCREGLKPFGQNTRNRILKQYILSLSYFRAKSELSIDNLLKILSDFEKREFPESIQHVSNIVLKYVIYFEDELYSKKNFTENEKKIKKALEMST